MCAVPVAIQRQVSMYRTSILTRASTNAYCVQLSEALTVISKVDYPDKWDTLLDNLIARLATTDFNVINGILETANSICKRFRNVYAMRCGR